MITFGFSAFLKLLSMNDRPRRSEVRRRLNPSGGAYDFHRSLRLHARRYLLQGASIADVLASAETITQLAERRSAVQALQRLELWRSGMSGACSACDPVTYTSPSALFRVRFDVDFALPMQGRRVAFHLWNTQKPQLSPLAAYLALTLIEEAYEGHDGAPDDVAVLSVREPLMVYRLNDVPDLRPRAARLVERLEDEIDRAGSTPPPLEDRPPPP